MVSAFLIAGIAGRERDTAHFFWIVGEVSDLMREGGGELSSVSDIGVGRTSETPLMAKDHPDETDRPTYLRLANDRRSKSSDHTTQDVNRSQGVFRDSIQVLFRSLEFPQVDANRPTNSS